MPKKTHEPQNRFADLLEKLIAFQLYALGVPHHRIARAVGRRRAWVDDLVRGLPKGGRSDGGQAKGKKAKRRASG